MGKNRLGTQIPKGGGRCGVVVLASRNRVVEMVAPVVCIEAAARDCVPSISAW